MNFFKQSPINIEQPFVQEKDIDITFEYRQQNFEVIDTGQNIALSPTYHKSNIKIANKRYFLTEIHFHKPSEHHVDDRQFEMEAHFVHEGAFDTVVYSLLLKIDDAGFDFSNPFANINNTIILDLEPFICNSRLWMYYGSYTTSPFAENVTWLINCDIGLIAPALANDLTNLYPCNNRCLQPVGTRNVYFVNQNK